MPEYDFTDDPTALKFETHEKLVYSSFYLIPISFFVFVFYWLYKFLFKGDSFDIGYRINMSYLVMLIVFIFYYMSALMTWFFD
jgi:hypothetical protein